MQASDDANVMLNGFGTVVNSLKHRAKPYLPQICGTIKWRLNNKNAKIRQQAADLIARIAVVMKVRKFEVLWVLTCSACICQRQVCFICSWGRSCAWGVTAFSCEVKTHMHHALPCCTLVCLKPLCGTCHHAGGSDRLWGP